MTWFSVCVLGLSCITRTAVAQTQTDARYASPISIPLPTYIESVPPSADSRISTSSSRIEQPGAVVPVFEQLVRLDSHFDATGVHILHLGDSHSAGDDWTAGLRRALVEKFGDGGTGFSLAGQPFRGYRRFDVREGGSEGWQTNGLRSGANDGLLGIGGVGISTRAAGQSVFIETECDYLEVFYLQQPGGGDLALYDRDQLIEKFSTSGAFGPGFIRHRTSPGSHRFILKTLSSKPVRLFGWVADRDRGITYESVGIIGAEASVILRWNDDLFTTYLRRRDPAMIVLAYGTNEANDSSWTSEKYASMFSSLMLKIRKALPHVSILVLGPPDCESNRGGVWRALPGLDRIIAAQREVCRATDCAFWDTRERMGGPGAIRSWVTKGLATTDRIHLTTSGYRLLAKMLFDDLMGDYELFEKLRLEISDATRSQH